MNEFRFWWESLSKIVNIFVRKRKTRTFPLKSMSQSYKNAGVDISAGDAASRLAAAAAKQHLPEEQENRCSGRFTRWICRRSRFW